MATVGDNVIDKNDLKSFVERMEKLEEEKADLGQDLKDVKGEAKNKGYDIKTLERIVRLRRQERRQREVEQEMLETYMHALGML